MDETLPPRNIFPSPGSTEGPGSDSFPTDLEGEELTRIGPYEVVERLGVGGMGVVYKCRDEALKRFVAVKVIRPKYARDESYRQRFQREAQTVASISHPSVAHVYGIGEFPLGDDSLIYIAMEYVDGPSVETLLQLRKALEPKEAVQLVRETALGLREALSRDIVHRDIKPSNLLVTPAGSVKIVDFGLAKGLRAQNSMTDVGVVLGTPHYISPEQGRGRPVDHRSDIYSLGATFFHMLTGHPPFEGDSQVSVIVAHVNDEPTPPHLVSDTVNLPTSRVVLRMMAKSTDSRYATYDQLIEDLEAIEQDREPLHAGGPLEPGATRPHLADPQTRTWLSLRWAAALVLVVVMSVVMGGLLLDLASSSGQPPPLWLGNWYRTLDGGQELVSLNFSNPPEGPPGTEVWRAALKIPTASSAESRPPQLVDGTLRWENYSRPIACSVAFERIDEIRLLVGLTRGTFDVGLILADPAGAEKRHLLLGLRPTEITPSPVLALRNNHEIPAYRLPLEPAGAASGETTAEGGIGEAPGTLQRPVPRLGQGPYEIFLAFQTDTETTVVQVRITRRQATLPLYQARLELAGTDWASGVVVLHTPSPVKPFLVALDRWQISGRLRRGSTVEKIPWRS